MAPHHHIRQGIISLTAILSASQARPPSGLREATHPTTRKLTGHFAPSRDPFSNVMPVASIPQFVVLTFDDSVTPWIIELYSQLANVRHQNGCPITATWYISIASANEGEVLTKCDLVNALQLGGHEIATHTYGHTSNPTPEDIDNAREWLAKECGVSREEVRGFRAPNLAYTQDTFESLQRLGFTYDSSVTERTDSDGGRHHLWPYTMDDCGSTPWSCDKQHSVPGLFEVPMWSMYEPGSESKQLIPMDYPGDAYATLTQNFERRYDVANGGNRAPMGIFLHASWLMQHGEDLRKWAEEILEKYNDVHFITNYQLLQWMSNPVPAAQYTRDDFCVDLKPNCLPPGHMEGGCGFGSFDLTTCKCRCPKPYGGKNCMQSSDNMETADETSTPAPEEEVEETTAAPEEVEETTAAPEEVEETTAAPEEIEETTAAPEEVAAPEEADETSAETPASTESEASSETESEDASETESEDASETESDSSSETESDSSSETESDSSSETDSDSASEDETADANSANAVEVASRAYRSCHTVFFGIFASAASFVLVMT